MVLDINRSLDQWIVEGQVHGTFFWSNNSDIFKFCGPVSHVFHKIELGIDGSGSYC